MNTFNIKIPISNFDASKLIDEIGWNKYFDFDKLEKHGLDFDVHNFDYHEKKIMLNRDYTPETLFYILKLFYVTYKDVIANSNTILLTYPLKKICISGVFDDIWDEILLNPGRVERDWNWLFIWGSFSERDVFKKRIIVDGAIAVNDNHIICMHIMEHKRDFRQFFDNGNIYAGICSLNIRQGDAASDRVIEGIYNKLPFNINGKKINLSFDGAEFEDIMILNLDYTIDSIYYIAKLFSEIWRIVDKKNHEACWICRSGSKVLDNGFFYDVNNESEVRICSALCVFANTYIKENVNIDYLFIFGDFKRENVFKKEINVDGILTLTNSGLGIVGIIGEEYLNVIENFRVAPSI